MRWTCLGHAAWLAEIGGRRVLMDPAFGHTHHDGLFEVFPPRDVDVAQLHPDVIIVTHCHPDHFDVPTLRDLAETYPTALVLTADATVARVARRLGFSDVKVVAERVVVPLGAGAIYTTPSFCAVDEWGILAWDQDGSVWNQVDSAVRDPATVREILAEASDALEQPSLRAGPDLALVRWCPLQQADGAVSGHLAAPLSSLQRELFNAAATGAGAIIPGSCGDRYVGWGAWQNQSVFPTTEGRFLRDLRVLLPQTPSFRAVPGHSWGVEAGVCTPLEPVGFVVVHPHEDDRLYAPFVLPPIVDPGEPAQENATLVRVAEWIGETLVPAVTRWAGVVEPPPLSLVLEIVLATRTVGLTLRVESGGVAVEVGSDLDHDALDRIAGTVLLDVIEGRSHWGRALLGGWMRSVRRAYTVTSSGLDPVPLPAFIVYLGMSYGESTERWIAHQLAGPSDAP